MATSGQDVTSMANFRVSLPSHSLSFRHVMGYADIIRVLEIAS